MVAVEDLIACAPKPGELSKRQRELLVMIGNGMKQQEMADALEIDGDTVHTHLRLLRDRLGLHKTAYLVRYAVHYGLVKA